MYPYSKKTKNPYSQKHCIFTVRNIVTVPYSQKAERIIVMLHSKQQYPYSKKQYLYSQKCSNSTVSQRHITLRKIVPLLSETYKPVTQQSETLYLYSQIHAIHQSKDLTVIKQSDCKDFIDLSTVKMICTCTCSQQHTGLVSKQVFLNLSSFFQRVEKAPGGNGSLQNILYTQTIRLSNHFCTSNNKYKHAQFLFLFQIQESF